MTGPLASPHHEPLHIPDNMTVLTDELSAPLLRDAERIAKLGAWSFDHATQAWSATPGMVRLVTGADTLSPVDYLNSHAPTSSPHAWNAHVADPTSPTFTGERRHAKPDGQVRIYRIVAETTRDDDGVAIASSGILLDVTAVVAARAALQTASTVTQALMAAGNETSILTAFTDAIVTVGGYRYCAYSRPATVWPPEDERRQVPRMTTIAFAGSDRWIEQEVERRSVLAWQEDRIVSLKGGVEDVVAPEAMFIPVHVQGAPDGILSVWADELTLLNGDQARLLPVLASSLATGMGRLQFREQARTAFAASIRMLVDAGAIDEETLEHFQALLNGLTNLNR